MAIWLVIPVKPFDDGKSRLAEVLACNARRKLNRAMFERTLHVARQVVLPDRLLIVSRSQEALELASRRGARTLHEQDSGDLNAALSQAVEAIRDTGATGILSLSADLPMIRSTDLTLILRDSERAPQVVIAPDRMKQGTNALLVCLPGAIPYHYGPDSFAAHLRLAREAGLDPRSADTPSLAFDLDTPDDLAEARRLGLIVGDCLASDFT